MTSKLKLSALQSQKLVSEEQAKAQAQIEELERQLAAERKANVSMATKLAAGRELADKTLATENNWLQSKIDELQHQRQLDALEALVGQDTKAQQKVEESKALRKELGEVKKTLKALQALEPEKQKKTIASQKKKMAEQTNTIKELNRLLKLANKEISQLKKAPEEAPAEES